MNLSVSIIISYLLLEAFSYHYGRQVKSFKGSSSKALASLSLSYYISTIYKIIAIIWMMIKLNWWQPIILCLVAIIIVSPIFSILFELNKNIKLAINIACPFISIILIAWNIIAILG